MVLKKNSERKVEYNRRYMADLRAQRRVNGLCTVCGAPARVGKTECHNCFTMHMQERDQRKEELLSTWVADVLIVDTRQTLLLSMTSIIRTRAKKQ